MEVVRTAVNLKPGAYGWTGVGAYGVWLMARQAEDRMANDQQLRSDYVLYAISH